MLVGGCLFKVRKKLESEHVEICTANHRIYRRISKEIIDKVVEQGIAQDFVQYSVDEFFGTLPLDDPDEHLMSVAYSKH